MLAQCINHDRGQADRAPPGIGFWRLDGDATGSSLGQSFAHMQPSLVQITSCSGLLPLLKLRPCSD
jgi:hypothetical protein